MHMYIYRSVPLAGSHVVSIFSVEEWMDCYSRGIRDTWLKEAWNLRLFFMLVCLSELELSRPFCLYAVILILSQGRVAVVVLVR